MAEGSVHHPSHDDHGTSVAAWTGVLVLLVASALIAVGIYIGQDIITILGVVVGVVGLAGAIVLSKLGFGVDAKRRQPVNVSASEGPDDNIGAPERRDDSIGASEGRDDGIGAPERRDDSIGASEGRDAVGRG